MQIAQVGVRTWQFIWTLITMALLGNAIHEAFAGNPSSVNYSMFVAVIDMAAVLIGFAAIFMGLPGIIVAGIDGVCAIATVIAGIVLAAELRVHSCSNNAYTSSNHLTNGSHNMKKRCQELQASTAFFWFLFPAFLISAFLAFKSGGSTGGLKRRGPVMSQV